MSQSTENGQRIALGQVLEKVEEVRDAQARQSRFGQFDQRLGPVAHQVPHANPQCRQACLDHSVPGLIAAIRGDLFGQWVLIRPETGDSAWVVDVGKGALVGTVDVHTDQGMLLGIPIIVIIKVVCEHIEQLQPVAELLGE